MRKLLFLFVAIFATTTLFGQYYSPISVSDGTAADWDALPAEYVASATHTEGCSYDGLKSVKVYCDDNYLNILVEVNLDVVTDREWTGFHIFLNADGSAETGGFADEFADADAEWMLETAIYSSGYVNSYNPAVFKWWGEVGGGGWQWTDPTQEGSFENCWGAIVCEGSYPAVGTSQMVDGDLGKVEIQLLKELIPAQWADEFTIGFDIQQNWTTCGILPNAADDELGNHVLAEKLKVQVNHSGRLPQDGLHYVLTSHVEPYTMAVVGADADITTATIPETIEVYGKTFAVTSIGERAFYKCSSLASITIPSSVTSIGNYAFAECSSLTSITIPNSITEINSGTFAYCSSLTSITIPNSVTSIGSEAFEDCTSLEYLYIPNSVQYTEDVYHKNTDGYRSIMNCPNLKTLIVPADFFAVSGDEEDYQDVKSDVFPYLSEKLESLTINDGTIHRLAWDFISRNYKTLKTIDLAATTDIAIAEEAFKNCYKLENLALPSQLEYIPYMAIAECVKLQSITIPATVTEIEDRAFENCRSIKSIIFEGAAPAQGPAHHAAASGSSLWRIGSWAFYNCHQLQDLTIPEGVTEIGDAAFYGCTYLEDMVLPSTIQEIGDNGFALCAKLQKIHVKATTPPTIQAKTFFDVNRQIPVYVPDNAVEAYKDDPYWQEFDIQGESKAPSAVDNIPSALTNTQKIMRDGQLLILRDGKTYNIMGAEIH